MGVSSARFGDTGGNELCSEISAARANRNVVDENVRIVIPQTHTLDVTLAALAHTGCRDATLHMHRQV